VANELIPYEEPGQRVTCQASAGVTGKRFVNISGNRTAGGKYQVAHATAAAAAFGVAVYDAVSGDPVGVIRAGIVPVTAGGTIAAGARVEVGTNGQAVTLASGIAVGTCCDGATNGNDARIALNLL
jgi:predicted RecA/RadA family phage recombinase